MDNKTTIIKTILITLTLLILTSKASASLQTDCRDICNQISIIARLYTNCSEINLLGISRDYYITNSCNNFGVCWIVMGNSQDCKVPMPEFIPLKNETIPSCNFNNTTATIERCNQLSSLLSMIANNNNNCTRINEYYCESREYIQRNCSINFGQTSVIMRNAQTCKIPEVIIIQEELNINNSENITIPINITEILLDNSSPINITNDTIITNSSPIIIEQNIKPISNKKEYSKVTTSLIELSNESLNQDNNVLINDYQTQNDSYQINGLLNNNIELLPITLDSSVSSLNYDLTTKDSTNTFNTILVFIVITALLVVKAIFINY